MSASSYSVTVEVINAIDSIEIQYTNSIDNITLSEVRPQINVIELQTAFAPLQSVNGYIGNPYFTASSLLGAVSPVGGIYTYSISHNLRHENPLVMLYNASNEIVSAEISASASDTVFVKSLIDLNGYKVVMQT